MHYREQLLCYGQILLMDNNFHTTAKYLGIPGNIRCTTGNIFYYGQHFLHHGQQLLYCEEFRHSGEHPLWYREQLLHYGQKLLHYA